MTQSVMTLPDALILGIVEGITEFLPISSTGHLVLASEMLGLHNQAQRTAEQIAAVQAFEIVIQAGAILAVAIIYWRQILEIIQGMLGRSPKGLLLLRNLLIATCPALLMGYALKDFISTHLQFLKPVLVAMILGGLVMLIFEKYFRKVHGVGQEKTIYDLSARQALAVGMIQCAALWPGMSRSMVTILGGMWVGLGRSAAAEFSFLVGLPTLLAATGYKGLKEGSLLLDSIGWEAISIGLVSSAIFAALAVKWLVAFLNSRGLALFGWYRIIVALVIGVYLGVA